MEQRQHVADQREEQRCQQRPHERAPPTHEARPAEDCRCDALERLVADDRRADLDLGGEIQAGERRHRGTNHERKDHGAIDSHPEAARRRLVETDRSERQPCARAVEPPVGEQSEDDDRDERDRNEADLRRQHVDHVAVDGAFGVVPQQERQALEDAQRAQRGNDRRQAEETDQGRVEEACGQSDANERECAEQQHEP